MSRGTLLSIDEMMRSQKAMDTIKVLLSEMFGHPVEVYGLAEVLYTPPGDQSYLIVERGKPVPLAERFYVLDLHIRRVDRMHGEMIKLMVPKLDNGRSPLVALEIALTRSCTAFPFPANWNAAFDQMFPDGLYMRHTSGKDIQEQTEDVRQFIRGLLGEIWWAQWQTQ